MMVMWEKEKVNEKDLVNALYLKANTLNDLLRKLKKKRRLLRAAFCVRRRG